MFFYLAVVGILGGISMIASGRDETWHGILAILVGLVALGMGIRDLGNTTYRLPREPVSSDLLVRGNDAPYTAADFPFPDPEPGHGISPAGTEPVPFAVIVPGPATEVEFREIGRRLTAWKCNNPDVTEITGLERLTLGQSPELPAWILYPAVRTDVDRVALVYVNGAAANGSTAEELKTILQGCPIRMVVGPDYYAAIKS